MVTYPLHAISIEEAIQKQFRFVDEVCREFKGNEILSLGDLGVVQPGNKPLYTEKVERVLASYFHAEQCKLVSGAGTGAIYHGLAAMLHPCAKVLIHKAPVYPTTLTSLQHLGADLITADFNQIEDIKTVLSHTKVDAAIIQFTRQQPEDSYDMQEVIQTIKECQQIPILTDDNYAVMKVPSIGVELGADLSAFSGFKLLGPEGVGILVGNARLLNQVEAHCYSGGSKVQGWQAMELLRMLVYAPVALAIQARENETLLAELNHGAIPCIQQAVLANAQSKVLLVEFQQDIAEQVLQHAMLLGAAPHPVGAESKYELVPMFYRVSGTFLRQDPTLAKRMIRINPMRSGSDTVLRILKESVSACF